MAAALAGVNHTAALLCAADGDSYTWWAVAAATAPAPAARTFFDIRAFTRDHAARKKMATYHLADGTRCAVAAFSSKLVPGRCIAARDSGAREHGERLLLYPLDAAPESLRWYVLYPDDSLGAEDLGGNGGAEEFYVLTDFGNGPSELRGVFYRFRHYPAQPEREVMLRSAQGEAAVLRPAGVAVPAVPIKYIDMEGNYDDAPDGIWGRKAARAVSAAALGRGGQGVDVGTVVADGGGTGDGGAAAQPSVAVRGPASAEGVRLGVVRARNWGQRGRRDSGRGRGCVGESIVHGRREVSHLYSARGC